ncbi:hypothetical protein GCM10011289_21420 [Paludibacterium paludis]|uniref:Uncharacterized protein n=2 Tax=Paludibacterium paludis TaxID=1225769 RepID=A0A918P3N2_9NEIS|nr:hypothetical protein GCM10011289_21420 [Paludibacterium paludis]
MLLEALVAMLVMTALGLGLVFTQGRAAVAQKTLRSQNLAVVRMRVLLQGDQAALCQTPSPTLPLTPSVSLPLTVRCSTRNMAVDAPAAGTGSAAVTVPVVTLSVSSPALLGPGTLTLSTVAP